MDPIPSVSWAFSLLLQEEQQRAIGSFPSITSVCSHCNIIGHIVDKCYKVHGYPPGYKTKQQQCSTNSNPSPTNTRNLVVVQQIDSTNVTKYWWCYFAMSDYFESVAILTLCCLSDWILFHFIYLTWCRYESFNLLDSSFRCFARVCCSKSLFTTMTSCSTSITLPDKQTFMVKKCWHCLNFHIFNTQALFP